MMNSSVFISFFFSTRRMLKSSWFDRDICLFKESTSLCSSHPFLCLCSGDPQQITMSDDASDHDATEAATAKKPSLICKKKKCKSGTTVSRCSVKNCIKCSCVACYKDMLSKHQLEPVLTSKGEIVMTCSKSHYTISAKNLSKQSDKDSPASSGKYSWNNDGKNGRKDPNTSEYVLLNWLMEEGNYAAFCKCDHGMTKKKFAIKIANLINDAGVTCRRDDKQVLNKISHIQKSFRETLDWAYNTTGQGLKEEDEDKWEATIRRRCPHFYDLLPIMGERASASPVIDSEKGIDTTDDSSDSLSDSASQSTYVPKDPPIAGKKLAKDVLQVGDIITYMATMTDQEGYIQTKKKQRKLPGSMVIRWPKKMMTRDRFSHSYCWTMPIWASIHW